MPAYPLISLHTHVSEYLRQKLYYNQLESYMTSLMLRYYYCIFTLLGEYSTHQLTKHSLYISCIQVHVHRQTLALHSTAIILVQTSSSLESLATSISCCSKSTYLYLIGQQAVIDHTRQHIPLLSMQLLHVHMTRFFLGGCKGGNLPPPPS